MAARITLRLRDAAGYGGARYLAHRALEPICVEWLEMAGSLALVEPPETADDVELVTWSKDGDLPHDFGALSPHLDAGTVRQRLDAGHLCFAALVDGRPAAAVWARDDSMWLPFLRRRIALAPGEVYLYDSHTVPRYRRSGLTIIRRSHSLTSLNRRGFHTGRAYVLARNVPGLAASRSAGWDVVARHRWAHLGPLGADLVATAGATRLRLAMRGRDTEL